MPKTKKRSGNKDNKEIRQNPNKFESNMATGDKLSLSPTHSRSLNRKEAHKDENGAQAVALGSQNPLVAPLVNYQENFGVLIGEKKGILGRSNSCYLDASLFSLFYATDIFDEALLKQQPDNSKADLACQVQEILREDIVNPLRVYQYCPATGTRKLRDSMKDLSYKLESNFMDAEEFLYLLLEDALKVQDFIQYDTDVTSNIHEVLIDNQDKTEYPTVQQLFETSMKLNGDLKLKSIPKPGLLIQTPRSNGELIKYKGIVPSLQLDITDLLQKPPSSEIYFRSKLTTESFHTIENQFPDQYSDSDFPINEETSESQRYDVNASMQTESPLFFNIIPRKVFYTMMLFGTIFFGLGVFAATFALIPWIIAVSVGIVMASIFVFLIVFIPVLLLTIVGLLLLICVLVFTVLVCKYFEVHASVSSLYQLVNLADKVKQRLKRHQDNRVVMDLLAVICIRGCHYTAFVRCGDELISRWIFFDSMAGATSKVEAVVEMPRFFERLSKYPFTTSLMRGNHKLRKLVEDNHIFIYKPRNKTM